MVRTRRFGDVWENYYEDQQIKCKACGKQSTQHVIDTDNEEEYVPAWILGYVCDDPKCFEYIKLLLC